MKKILYLAAIVPAFLFSCKKEAAVKNGLPNPLGNIAIDTKVEGLKDITMLQTDVYELPVIVKYISGTKEKVGISLTNMPPKVFAAISSQLDTPSYSSVIKFNAMNADTGTTTVTLLSAASKDSSARSYTFNVTILPSPVNYALDLVGNYTHSGSCDNAGPVNNPAHVYADPSKFNRIKIERIWTGTSNSYYVYADIDPANHTVNIPAQTNNGILYTGSGTYTVNQINLTYQFTDGNLVHDNCTVTLTR